MSTEQVVYMFRYAFDDWYYVYSYIPAREKENNFITWMLQNQNGI